MPIGAFGITDKQAQDLVTRYREGTMRRIQGLLGASRNKLHQIGIKPGTVQDMLKFGEGGTPGTGSATGAGEVSEEKRGVKWGARGAVMHLLTKMGALGAEGALGPTPTEEPPVVNGAAPSAPRTVKRETAYGQFCPGAIQAFLEKHAFPVEKTTATPKMVDELSSDEKGNASRYLTGGLTGMGIARAISWLGRAHVPERLEKRLGIAGIIGGLGAAEIARRMAEKQQRSREAVRAALDELRREQEAQRVAQYLRELGVRPRRLPPGAIHVGGVAAPQPQYRA